MSDDDVVGADPVVPRRTFVPSLRQVEEGRVEYCFEPLPPPEPSEPFDVRQKARELKHQLNLREIVAGQPALPLVLLSLDALFSKWDDAAFTVLLPEIRDEFGFDLGFLLTLGSVVGIVIICVSPVFGFLADRISRVKMLAVGNVAQNASSILAGQAGSVPQLSAARAFGGLGGGISGPVAIPLIADWYPMRTRARLVALVTFAAGVGGVAAPLIAGVMGDRLGWRATMTILGGLATVISALFFLLRDPVRGGLDRKAMGASDEVAATEQKPVSWAEGWRAASRIATLRRLWYVTPFLTAGAEIQGTLMAVYYSDEFGLSASARGLLVTSGAAVGLLALPFAGPLADRLLAVKPGRVFTLIGSLSLVSTASLVVVAFSPFLWLSVATSVPLGVLSVLTFPALTTLMSMVVPARLRSFGVATQAPWRLMGRVLIIVAVVVFQFGDIRSALFVLVPLNLIGALLVGSAGSGVERDIRAATAASLADEEARRARASGANKMIICRDVDVTYDGTQVLFNVDFDVDEGELVALLGTNGAGKSTLLRAICGVQEVSNGAIFMDGEDITHRPPHQNAAGGIVFMPGGQAVFPSLTVEENLRAAAWMYREDEEYVTSRTSEVLDLFPVLRSRAKQQAGSMSGGEQQMLALGQAFLMKPRLLMIDELSLGLAPAIVEQLLQILRRINAEGVTVVLVEQSANVALTVARRAVFMEKGEILFDGPTEQLLGRGDLLRSVFLGGAAGGAAGSIATGRGLFRIADGTEDREPVLEVENVHLSYGGHRALTGVSLAVEGGEVLGIIGPNGAGKTTLFDAISGYAVPDQGVVRVNGTDVSRAAPDVRARCGLARSFQHARLFPSLTVKENIAVALEQRLSSRGILPAAIWLPAARRSERRATRRVEYLIDLMQLDAYASKFVDELSTGTRRMVDMACVMAAEPRVLLLDEPSSGLAQAEVEVLGPVIRRLAKETGSGILVIEHDVPLITGLADRLIAMELGSVLVEGAPAEVVADERVTRAYLGASDAVIARSGGVLQQALDAAGVLPP